MLRLSIANDGSATVILLWIVPDKMLLSELPKKIMNFANNDLANSEIVVRVGTIEEPRQFGEGKFVIFKFIVENEKSLRIQCIAMEDQIERIRPLVKKNTIIRIKGATSKREQNPKYNTGDVPFVLMIYANTTITVLKDYDPDETSEDT